jgi:hypothetical protein
VSAIIFEISNESFFPVRAALFRRTALRVLKLGLLLLVGVVLWLLSLDLLVVQLSKLPAPVVLRRRSKPLAGIFFLPSVVSGVALASVSGSDIFFREKLGDFSAFSSFDASAIAS